MKNKQPKQDARNVYARKWYKAHKEARKEAVKKCRAKKKALDAAKAEGLFSCPFQSSFDMFMVQLYIGPFELAAEEQPTLAEMDVRGKEGLTASAPGQNGAVVWLRSWNGDNYSLTTLFHELVHASFARFRANGIDVKDGALDEAVACSVSETGGYFLMSIREWQERKTQGAPA